MDREQLRRRWTRVLGEDPLTGERSTVLTYRTLPLPATTADEAREDRCVPRERIGAGGMGEVFRGTQTSFGRDVALKMLRRDLAREGSEAAHYRRGFIAEALITGRLEHPNIVPAYRMGTTDQGEPYLALKLVGGESWETLLQRGDTDHDAIAILIQVCHAAAFAHSRGVVHNDLKPANVMIGAFGEVLVMDWGLSACFGEELADLRGTDSIDAPCGTPAYMPPELAEGRGDEIGPATDIYLLGGMLYRIFAGRAPHAGRNFFEVLVSASNGDLPELGPVPAALRPTVERALAARPEDRHPDVKSFQAELLHFQRCRQSHALAEGAAELLDGCRGRVGGELADEAKRRLYQDFAEAIAGFNQALRLWPENPTARDGRLAARREYAEAALARDDLGQAEALLGDAGEDDDLRSRVRARRAALAAEKSSRKRLQWLLGSVLCVLFLLLAAGIVRERRHNAALSRKSAESHQRAVVARDLLLGVVRAAREQVADELILGPEQQVAQTILTLARGEWASLRSANWSGREAELDGIELGLAEASLQQLLGVAGDSVQAALQEAVLWLEKLGAARPEERRPRVLLAAAHGLLATQARNAAYNSTAIESYGRQAELLRGLLAQEDDPHLRAQLAICLARFAHQTELNGAPHEALVPFRASLETFEGLPVGTRTDAVRHDELDARVLALLARWKAGVGATRAEAVALHEAVAALAAEAPSARGRWLLANVLIARGRIEGALQRWEEAEAHLQEALELAESFPASTRSPLAHGVLASALGELAEVLVARGRYAEARALCARNLAQLAPRAEGSAIFPLHAAMSEVTAAKAARELGHTRTAAYGLSRAVGSFDELAADRPTDTWVQLRCAMTERELAWTWVTADSLAAARAPLASSRARCEAVLAAHPGHRHARRDLVETLRLQAVVALHGGRLDEAEGCLVEARAVVATMLADAVDPDTRYEAAAIEVRYGEWLTRSGRWDDAIAVLEEAVAALAPLGFPSAIESRSWALTQLATALRGAGRGAEAGAILEEAYALEAGMAERAPAGRNLRRVLLTASLLGSLHVGEGDFSAAVEANQRTVAWARALFERYPEEPRSPWLLSRSLCDLARPLVYTDPQGSRALFAEALPLARRVAEMHGRHDHLRDVLLTYGQLREALGEYEEAARLFAELLDLDAMLYAAEPREDHRARLVDSLLRVGMYRTFVGDLDGALASYEEVERLTPEDPVPLLRRADILRVRGDFAGAVGLHRQAWERVPEDRALGFELALAQELAGHREEARATLEAVLAVDPAGGIAPYCAFVLAAWGTPEALAAWEDYDAWPGPLVRAALTAPEQRPALTVALAAVPAEMRDKRRCEWLGFLALYDECRGRDAQDAYRACVETGLQVAPEQRFARDRLRQLGD